MIAIIDYGAGNLHSVKNALDFLNAESIVTGDSETILNADKVILPGVGAFGDAMKCLEKSGLVETVKAVAKSGKPLLGICLGLHLMFEESDETPGVKGLGIFKGKIVKIPEKDGLKIPHMGWNQLELTQPKSILWEHLPSQPWVYFVHSYYVDPVDPQIRAATVTHGTQTITAAIAHENLTAVQFHPEKSSNIGLQILSNFVAQVREKIAA